MLNYQDVLIGMLLLLGSISPTYAGGFLNEKLLLANRIWQMAQIFGKFRRNFNIKSGDKVSLSSTFYACFLR